MKHSYEINRWIQTALSNSRKAVSFSSARTTKRFPSPRCAQFVKKVSTSLAIQTENRHKTGLIQKQINPAIKSVSYSRRVLPDAIACFRDPVFIDPAEPDKPPPQLQLHQQVTVTPLFHAGTPELAIRSSGR